MTSPIRLRLSRAKGFNLQAASRAINGLPAVNCARPGKWGNPWWSIREGAWWFVEGPGLSPGQRFGNKCGASMVAVNLFRCWVDGLVGLLADRRAQILAEVPSLRNHNLACWCPLPAPGEPDHCHAAVLLEIANR